MKKILIIVPVLALTFASCKKDRVCSCKQVAAYTGTYTGVAGTKPADSKFDSKYTIVDASAITANRACVHTKTVGEESQGIKLEIDTNCSLD